MLFFSVRNVFFLLLLFGDGCGGSGEDADRILPVRASSGEVAISGASSSALLVNLLLFSVFFAGLVGDGELAGEDRRRMRRRAGAEHLRRAILLARGGGGALFGVLPVALQVSFCFLRAKAGDGDATTDGGFVRKGLASSLRRGGCYKSSPFCGIHFSAAGRCASSGGSLPAIVFLDGGGGQRMPVFTRCGDGRCAWEAIYSASSLSSKFSSAVSTLWTSSLVRMTAIALAPAD